MIGVTRLFQRNVNRTEAHRHLAARNWSEAERSFQLALEERRHSPLDRLELLLGLAEAQRRRSKLDEAERSACDAIKIAIREESAIMHSLALDALASVQFDQQRYAEAEKSAREVIRLESGRAKPDHARLASCSSKLASVLERSDRPVDAIEALKTALSHAEKAFGAEHPETAGHLRELGMLHRRHGHHGAAQGCFRRALGIRRAEAGEDSREATQMLYNLAASLEESGNLNDAAAEFEKLLALHERQVGADPAETAGAQVRLAALHLRTGRIPAARELLIRAMPALERKGGLMLAQALETFAGAEELSGRPDQAREYHEKALLAAAFHVANTGE